MADKKMVFVLDRRRQEMDRVPDPRETVSA